MKFGTTDLNRGQRRKLAHDERRGVDTNAPDYFPDPIVVRPETARQMLGCGQTRLYELVNSGELDSFVDGRRRYITTESIYRYVARRLAEASPSSYKMEKATAAALAARKARRA